jgi:3-hydroxyacyl-[acyl-carrier-protein] dehydratase
MPPPLLFSLDNIDLDHIELTREQIYQLLPHRAEFMQLDGLIHFDPQNRWAVGLREVREDDWWARGHIPGRPIFPGILMVETAAHLACLFNRFCLKDHRFLAFGGMDQVKFRDVIIPPARMIVLGAGVQVKPRRTICDVQGLVGDTLVFEGRIRGYPMELDESG